MKKIIKFLVISILLVPLLVLADGGGPTFAPYDAYVSDPNGASLYKYDDDNDIYVKTSKVLEYNTQIEVEDEEEITKDKIYGYIGLNDEDYFYISLDKISLKKDVYTLEDYKKDFSDDEDIPEHAKVLILDNEVYPRKGPSTKYEKIDKSLKKEDKISKKAEIGSWVYVENDSISGWINTDDNNVMETIYRKTLWLLEDVHPYDNYQIDEHDPIDLTIPKNEKFEDVFHIGINEDEEENEETKYYDVYRLEYNGKAYYIDSDEVAFALSTGNKYSDITNKKTNCYNEVNGTIIATLPINTEAKVMYTSYNMKEDWAYIESNGRNYWVSEKDTATLYKEKIILVDDTPASVNNDDKVNITLPANTVFSSYYYRASEFRVEYKGQYYWFNPNNSIGIYIGDEYSDFETEEEVNLYDKPNGKKLDIVIPKNTKVNIRYNYYENLEDDESYRNNVYVDWYFVDDNTYSGWITNEQTDMEEFKARLAKRDQEKNSKKEKYEDDDSYKNDEPEELEADNSLSKKEMIIICSLSAVIIALASFVCILLINKKRKAKKEEVPVPEVDNTTEIPEKESSTEPNADSTEVVVEKEEETTIILEKEEEKKDA